MVTPWTVRVDHELGERSPVKHGCCFTSALYRGGVKHAEFVSEDLARVVAKLLNKVEEVNDRRKVESAPTNNAELGRDEDGVCHHSGEPGQVVSL
jgi:hypothetical protein